MRIENQAIVFALLCKYTVETEGEKGREVIQKGVIRYGREYCVNVDKAVYEGFCEDFVCTPNVPTMSWGGKRCEFDWGQPLTEEDLAKMNRKKQELGTSAMRNTIGFWSLRENDSRELDEKHERERRYLR